MRSRRCAECGHFEQDALRNPVFGNFWDVTWASVDGVDVCPECQTPTEKAMIRERFLNHLSAHADWRDWLLEGQRDHLPLDATVPSHDLSTIVGSDQQRVLVAMTSAFSTDCAITVDLNNYDNLRESIKEHIRRPGWTDKAFETNGGTYLTGGGFTSKAPLIVAAREKTKPDMWRKLAALTTQEFRSVGLAARAIDIDIQLYDLGVAVMTLWISIRLDAAAKLATLSESILDVSRLDNQGGPATPLAVAIQSIARETTIEFQDSVEKLGSTVPTQSWVTESSEKSSAKQKDSSGLLLWLHPVLIVTAPRGGLRKIAESVTPNFNRTVNIGKHAVFVAGVGRSAVVMRPGSLADEMPIRLTLLHWAYYALYMNFDRDLLNVLADPHWRGSSSLRRLEADAEAVAADHLRVALARARLDSELNSLGGDEAAVWSSIAEVQYFETVTKAVDRKLSAMDKLASQRMEQATANRTRLIGNTLGFLSALGFVTLCLGVLGATTGTFQNKITQNWPVWTAVCALALAALGWWVAFYRSVLRPRPRRRERAAGSR